MYIKLLSKSRESRNSIRIIILTGVRIHILGVNNIWQYGQIILQHRLSGRYTLTEECTMLN